MSDTTLAEIQQYRQVIQESQSVPLTEAPTQAQLDRVQSLINGPHGEEWLDRASKNSGIARSHMRDLLTMSPEEFGRKYRREGAYLGNTQNEINAASAVRDHAERYRDQAVNRITQGLQTQTARRDTRPQQAATPQQQNQPRPQGRTTMDPRVSAGDPQATQQRSGGSSSFGAAFKQARLAGKTEFTHNGKRYTTRRESEKEPFWLAKMKFLANPSSLSAGEVRTLQSEPGKLGPNEKKKIDALAASKPASSAPQQQPAAPQQAPQAAAPRQTAPQAAAPAQRAGGSDFARRVQADPDYARRVIAAMGKNESRLFKSSIITEQETVDDILAILSNPSHSRHEEYARRFLDAEKRIKARGSSAAAKPAAGAAAGQAQQQTASGIDAEIAKLKKEDAAYPHMAAKAHELYKKWRSEGKTPKQIGKHLASKRYNRRDLWMPHNQPQRSLYTMLVASGLYRPGRVF